jgi:hypothetical protein
VTYCLSVVCVVHIINGIYMKGNMLKRIKLLKLWMFDLVSDLNLRYVVATLLITKNDHFWDVDIVQSGRSVLNIQRSLLSLSPCYGASRLL